MQIEITIRHDEEENTRKFRFEDTETLLDVDWNYKMEELVDDFTDYLNDISVDEVPQMKGTIEALNKLSL